MDEGQIREIKPCGIVNTIISNPMSETYGKFATKTRRVAAALARLDELFAQDQSRHEANLPAIEANTAIREEIKALMRRVKMPEAHGVRDTRSRASYPKYNTEPTGWVLDLDRFVQVNDGFDSAKSSYARLKAEFERATKQAQAEDEEAKRKAEYAGSVKKSRREADLELLDLCRRYGFDPGTDYEEALDRLTAANGRLDLAVAMMRVRGGWSEGCDAVESAYGRFKPETDQDKDIAASVSDAIDDFGYCGDGCIFRDCVWSYGDILATLDKQLAADAMFLYENINWS